MSARLLFAGVLVAIVVAVMVDPSPKRIP